MNFVCTVFEQVDEMLTLLSMEKTMVECNLLGCPGVTGNASASLDACLEAFPVTGRYVLDTSQCIV